MSNARERRIRAVHARCASRSWKYRQRNHAAGVWYRLRRLLAGAHRAYVVDDRDLEALLQEGLQPDPVGAKLEPPKQILFVPDERVATLASRRAIPINLGAELLSCRNLVLVRF